MDSIIKKLRFMLNVGTASFNLLPIGYGEHNIPMFGRGVRLFYYRAGGCHSQYLDRLRIIQDKYDSPRTFSSPMSIVASVF